MCPPYGTTSWDQERLLAMGGFLSRIHSLQLDMLLSKILPIPSMLSPGPAPSCGTSPGLCLASSPLSARDRWGSVLFPLLPAPRLPQPYHFLPPEPHRAPSYISGVDIRHRLPCHLHKRQEVELVRAEAEVDPVQEIQVPGHLGQGWRPRVAWGTGQGPQLSPVVRITRTLISALPPVHRGPHPHAGTWPLTCLPGILWHCMPLHLGDGHMGEVGDRLAQDSTELAPTLVSGCPVPE